jgi:hypothetical protein
MPASLQDLGGVAHAKEMGLPVESPLPASFLLSSKGKKEIQEKFSDNSANKHKGSHKIIAASGRESKYWFILGQRQGTATLGAQLWSKPEHSKELLKLTAQSTVPVPTPL